MDNFLPEDYDIPAGASNYMKFEEGTNTFRVLSSAITGWEYWTEDKEGKKPNRVKKFEELPDEVKSATDNKDKARHFWAFVVYNQVTKTIQILEISQKTVMRDIKGLINNPKWGDPKGYDITVNKIKTGSESRDVEYSTMPEPKEELDKEVVEQYKEKNINLSALYKGEDPFSSTGEDKDSDFIEELMEEKDANS